MPARCSSAVPASRTTCIIGLPPSGASLPPGPSAHFDLNCCILLTMRVLIDASPLLIRSAGVKNYLYHWIAALRRIAPAGAIRTFRSEFLHPVNNEVTDRCQPAAHPQCRRQELPVSLDCRPPAHRSRRGHPHISI